MQYLFRLFLVPNIDFKRFHENFPLFECCKTRPFVIPHNACSIHPKKRCLISSRFNYVNKITEFNVSTNTWRGAIALALMKCIFYFNTYVDNGFALKIGFTALKKRGTKLFHCYKTMVIIKCVLYTFIWQL